MTDTLSLHWTLKRNAAGDALTVQYQLKNTGAEAVYVLDQMLALGANDGYDQAPDAMIVRADASDPGLVHLMRGRVAPQGRPMQEVPAALRTLAPGAEITGTAHVALPLQSWHPNDGYRPLAAPPKRAVLELGVLSGKTETEAWPTSHGDVKIPEWAAARSEEEWVRGEVQPLP